MVLIRWMAKKPTLPRKDETKQEGKKQYFHILKVIKKN